MTAQLSREDVKELRNSFQCWQQDYDPKDDAEQYEMFGRAITATDMLLAGMDSDPVIIVGNDGGDALAYRRLIQSFAPGTKLYAAPPAPVAGVDDDVRNIIGLLETNEWAEHCTSTVLGSRLESEITRLVGEKQPAPVAVPDIATPQSMRTMFCQLDDSECAIAADVWNACRDAMLKAGPVTAATVPEALASSVKCWCRTCRPVTITDMRFVVCPDCGNKRCPRANDHRNACSGSNEPGQSGSAYPAAPEQEV